jgi:hypothetical protein
VIITIIKVVVLTEKRVPSYTTKHLLYHYSLEIIKTKVKVTAIDFFYKAIQVNFSGLKIISSNKIY